MLPNAASVIVPPAAPPAPQLQQLTPPAPPNPETSMPEAVRLPALDEAWKLPPGSCTAPLILMAPPASSCALSPATVELVPAQERLPAVAATSALAAAQETVPSVAAPAAEARDTVPPALRKFTPGSVWALPRLT